MPLSGKLSALSRLLEHIKDTTEENCVLVSHYTSTLNILEAVTVEDGNWNDGQRMRILFTGLSTQILPIASQASSAFGVKREFLLRLKETTATYLASPVSLAWHD
ncbi:uncharacterized protein ARMOST_02566 [Armillaria ostoyae]|uniref:Uncharacterized protein n=1 Tax=Armillaria ostoyae TaxID=47428 RepID=A0A284QS33_ARMOS|nr:uncharacterized protein ARMOST_02566 [Armillaria ostoyae]